MEVSNIKVLEKGICSKPEDYVPTTHQKRMLETDEVFDNDCFVGVEMEVEGIDFFRVMDECRRDYIEVLEDGSLKYKGIEMRFRYPMKGTSILSGLEEIGDICSKFSDRVYLKGERGSTHLHFDVSSMTLPELINFYCLSALIEPYLYTQCTLTRESTVFCVPISKTRDLDYIITNLCKGYLEFGSDFYKYRGIGLNSIHQRGSLEFRMFDTCVHPPKILHWINLLQRVRDVAFKINFSFFSTCNKRDLEGLLHSFIGIPSKIDPRALKQMYDIARQISTTFMRLQPRVQEAQDEEENVGHVPVSHTSMIEDLVHSVSYTYAASPTGPTTATFGEFLDDFESTEET